MQSESLYKVSCDRCGNRIAFPREYLNQVIQCPHCQESTALVVPEAEPASPELPPPPPTAERGEIAAAPVPTRRSRWRWVWAGAGILLLLAGGGWLYAGYRNAGVRIQIEWKVLPVEYPHYVITGRVVNRDPHATGTSRARFQVVKVTEGEDGARETLEWVEVRIPPIPPGEEQAFREDLPAGFLEVARLAWRPRPGWKSWLQPF